MRANAKTDIESARTCKEENILADRRVFFGTHWAGGLPLFDVKSNSKRWPADDRLSDDILLDGVSHDRFGRRSVPERDECFWDYR